MCKAPTQLCRVGVAMQLTLVELCTRRAQSSSKANAITRTRTVGALISCTTLTIILWKEEKRKIITCRMPRLQISQQRVSNLPFESEFVYRFLFAYE